MEYTKTLLTIFNVIVRSEDERTISPAEVNAKAVRAGFYFEPEACTEAGMRAVESLGMNYNSTFYKGFEDVLKRTRFDQLMDQLQHYASTYGTDFSAPVFTQNPTPAAMLYKTLTIVRAVSPHEMYEMSVALLNGPALKNETLQAVCGYIAYYLHDSADTEAKNSFCIKEISNREARSALYIAMKQLPDEPLDFLRVAVYAVTGSGLIINSAELLTRLATEAGNSQFCLGMFARKLPWELTEGLASIYFRFKHIFIGLKQGFRYSQDREKGKAAVSYINYLRKLAPRYKKPFRADVLSSLLACEWSEEEIGEAVLNECSTFRLVRCLGYLKMVVFQPDVELYFIRNGKAYIRGAYHPADRTEQAIRYGRIIEEEIVRRIRRNVEGKKIGFSDKIELAAPTSEKNFVGNVPFMSSLRMGESCFTGIYWREEWGTHDFDLSAVLPEDNKKIGWNEDYVSSGQTIVYSGDMTTAHPEATEILYFKKDVPLGLIYVNRFYGEEGSTYRLFFGMGESKAPEDEIKTRDLYSGLGFGVKVMDVVLEADVVSDSEEQLVGFICDNRFYFMTLATGRGAVSRNKDYDLQGALSFRRYSAVNLRELLLKAGAEAIIDGENEVDIDLRPRALNRTTIIDIFKTEGE